MIAFLAGTLKQLNADNLILMVQGVGYRVWVGPKLVHTCGQPGTTLELFIHSHIREDRFELYGFNNPKQLELFKQMIDISGIGPKTALDIVDKNPQQIIEAVQQAQVSFFTPIPRIGKKMAQKIILELKPKLGSLRDLNLGPKSAKEQDVYDALVALGFDETQISRAMEKINVAELKVELAVKKLVKSLGKK